MIQSIENYLDTSIISSLYSNNTTSTTENQNVSAEDFDEILNQTNNSIKNTDESQKSSEVLTQTTPIEQSQSTNDSSNNEKSSMDLNGDGKVTIDEIMKYMQKKISANIEEQIKSAVEYFSGSEENSGINLQNFNLKNAVNAYQAGQNIISAVLK